MGLQYCNNLFSCLFLLSLLSHIVTSKRSYSYMSKKHCVWSPLPLAGLLSSMSAYVLYAGLSGLFVIIKIKWIYSSEYAYRTRSGQGLPESPSHAPRSWSHNAPSLFFCPYREEQMAVGLSPARPESTKPGCGPRNAGMVGYSACIKNSSGIAEKWW